MKALIHTVLVSSFHSRSLTSTYITWGSSSESVEMVFSLIISLILNSRSWSVYWFSSYNSSPSFAFLYSSINTSSTPSSFFAEMKRTGTEGRREDMKALLSSISFSVSISLLLIAATVGTFAFLIMSQMASSSLPPFLFPSIT